MSFPDVFKKEGEDYVAIKIKKEYYCITKPNFQEPWS